MLRFTLAADLMIGIALMYMPIGCGTLFGNPNGPAEAINSDLVRIQRTDEDTLRVLIVGLPEAAPLGASTVCSAVAIDALIDEDLTSCDATIEEDGSFRFNKDSVPMGSTVYLWAQGGGFSDGGVEINAILEDIDEGTASAACTDKVGEVAICDAGGSVGEQVSFVVRLQAASVDVTSFAVDILIDGNILTAPSWLETPCMDNMIFSCNPFGGDPMTGIRCGGAGDAIPAGTNCDLFEITLDVLACTVDQTYPITFLNLNEDFDGLTFSDGEFACQ